MEEIKTTEFIVTTNKLFNMLVTGDPLSKGNMNIIKNLLKKIKNSPDTDIGIYNYVFLCTDNYKIQEEIIKSCNLIIKSDLYSLSEKLIIANYTDKAFCLLIQKRYIDVHDDRDNSTIATQHREIKNLRETIISLDKKSEELKNNIDSAFEDNNRLKVETKNLKSSITTFQNNMKEIRNNIYTDFIAILGIFTAITFATFGGLQLFHNMFTNIGKLPTSSIIGKILCLSAIFGIMIYGIIETLFRWISEIKNSEIHKSNIWLLFILFIILILGLLILGLLHF
ncbi:hypothetical protein DS831_05980 [Bombilactobacillus bombi]|uniref:Uncharacterized protein n=1 Tax=Bombilactobacillus bombi TaxID=1303590 RepID=A0A417ZEI8_9LACO|nr:hypothetical protein [Bombilactobacillus bombi]RHW49710.1 hypothetical protein DS831_05980 [Bombilactobacillus bombi]